MAGSLVGATGVRNLQVFGIHDFPLNPSFRVSVFRFDFGVTFEKSELSLYFTSVTH